MVADCCKHEITLIKDKQNTQIPTHPAFVEAAEWSHADAGMQMRTPENMVVSSNF